MSFEKSLYDISSYGLDYPIEVLISMLNRGDLEAPDFQRNYVWQIGQASKFVESCIVGLPIPTIFFFRDKDNKFLIVDGLQRLMTAKFFTEGVFKNRTFALSLPENAELNGKKYDELSLELKRRFDQCVLRATVFTQNKPETGMKSVYEVFSRLNSGGAKLTSHEVRNAIIRGKINKFLEQINEHPSWRKLYGKKESDIHRRDEETILRILALHERSASYTPPMNLFLNEYMEQNENPNVEWLEEKRNYFKNASDLLLDLFGKDAFRVKKGSQINIAIADSLMVSFIKHNNLIMKYSLSEKKDLKKRFELLKQDPDFLDAIEKNTSDTKRVKQRIKMTEQTVKGQ